MTITPLNRGTAGFMGEAAGGAGAEQPVSQTLRTFPRELTGLREFECSICPRLRDLDAPPLSVDSAAARIIGLPPQTFFPSPK